MLAVKLAFEVNCAVESKGCTESRDESRLLEMLTLQSVLRLVFSDRIYVTGCVPGNARSKGTTLVFGSASEDVFASMQCQQRSLCCEIGTRQKIAFEQCSIERGSQVQL